MKTKYKQPYIYIYNEDDIENKDEEQCNKIYTYIIEELDEDLFDPIFESLYVKDYLEQ